MQLLPPSRILCSNRNSKGAVRDSINKWTSERASAKAEDWPFPARVSEEGVLRISSLSSPNRTF